METNKVINFESHIPYYIQLMDLLKDQINNKVWLPGCKFLANRICAKTMASAEQLSVRRYGKWNWKVPSPAEKEKAHLFQNQR